jgi:hypothetical protein
LTTGLSARTALSYLSFGYLSFGGEILDKDEAIFLSDYMESRLRDMKKNFHK